jgi:hypothetical protein
MTVTICTGSVNETSSDWDDLPSAPGAVQTAATWARRPDD